MNWNDIAVVTCDVLSTVCLGLLAVGSIAGTQVSVPTWAAIGLWVVGKAATTILGHLRPVGSARAASQSDAPRDSVTRAS